MFSRKKGQILGLLVLSVLFYAGCPNPGLEIPSKESKPSVPSVVEEEPAVSLELVFPKASPVTDWNTHDWFRVERTVKVAKGSSGFDVLEKAAKDDPKLYIFYKESSHGMMIQVIVYDADNDGEKPIWDAANNNLTSVDPDDYKMVENYSGGESLLYSAGDDNGWYPSSGCSSRKITKDGEKDRWALHSAPAYGAPVYFVAPVVTDTESNSLTALDLSRVGEKLLLSVSNRKSDKTVWTDSFVDGLLAHRWDYNSWQYQAMNKFDPFFDSDGKLYYGTFNPGSSGIGGVVSEKYPEGPRIGAECYNHDADSIGTDVYGLQAQRVGSFMGAHTKKDLSIYQFQQNGDMSVNGKYTPIYVFSNETSDDVTDIDFTTPVGGSTAFFSYVKAGVLKAGWFDPSKTGDAAVTAVVFPEISGVIIEVDTVALSDGNLVLGVLNSDGVRVFTVTEGEAPVEKDGSLWGGKYSSVRLAADKFTTWDGKVSWKYTLAARNGDGKLMIRRKSDDLDFGFCDEHFGIAYDNQQLVVVCHDAAVKGVVTSVLDVKDAGFEL